MTDVTLRDEDRDWLLSVFDALARSGDDVVALLEFRERAKMKARSWGRLGLHGERFRSPGRRLSDLFGDGGPGPAP